MRERIAAVTAEALAAWLRPRLAKAERPREITVVGELPLSATGKPTRPLS